MKKVLLLLCLFVISSSQAQQISITAQDMPEVDDTLRLSISLPSTSLNYQATGQNHTWDFSDLRPATQRIERFVNVTSTPLFYQLAFSSPLVTNRATIASPIVIPENLRELASGTLQNFTIEDIILFYRQTTAEFEELGFGATINGLTAPIKYETPDVIYRFPVEYTQKDSSLSSLEVDYTTQSIYFAQDRKRVNHADGWGTLTTPFGTFNVLRVVSTLYVTDTLKTADNPGVRTQRPIVREYKWLGKEQGIPLLQVNTAEANGQEVILTISYRDIKRNLDPPLSASLDLPEVSIKAFPSPLGETDALTLELPSTRQPAQITVFDQTGKMVFQKSVHSTPGNPVHLPATVFSPSRGLYLLRIETGEAVVVKKIIRK